MRNRAALPIVFAVGAALSFGTSLYAAGAAGDLFGDPELVRGVHQMCEDIIAGYASGAQALYQIRVRKPAQGAWRLDVR